MKVIVPINNFIIDKSFTLNEIYFMNSEEGEQVLRLKQKSDVEIIDLGDGRYRTNIQEITPLMSEKDIHSLFGKTLAVVDSVSDIYNKVLNVEERKKFLSSIIDKVNRTLDFIRINYCNVVNQLELPGIPSVLEDGFSLVLILNPVDENIYKVLVERLYGLRVVDGIGLMYDGEGIVDDSLFYTLFSTEEDEISILCKSIVKRINEAMYIPDIDSRFIYLMSTIETLASPKYIGFSDVKKKIGPIICESKERYHEFGHEMRNISQNIRTEIVHNGKSLVALRPGDYEKILINLQSLLVRTIIKITSNSIKSYDELEAFIELRKEELDIKGEERINDEKMLVELIEYYEKKSDPYIEKKDFIDTLKNVKKGYLKGLHQKVLGFK